MASEDVYGTSFADLFDGSVRSKFTMGKQTSSQVCCEMLIVTLRSRTPGEQAMQQLGALLCTLGVALVGGKFVQPHHLSLLITTSCPSRLGSLPSILSFQHEIR